MSSQTLFSVQKMYSIRFYIPSEINKQLNHDSCLFKNEFRLPIRMFEHDGQSTDRSFYRSRRLFTETDNHL